MFNLDLATPRLQVPRFFSPLFRRARSQYCVVPSPLSARMAGGKIIPSNLHCFRASDAQLNQTRSRHLQAQQVSHRHLSPQSRHLQAQLMFWCSSSWAREYHELGKRRSRLTHRCQPVRTAACSSQSVSSCMPDVMPVTRYRMTFRFKNSHAWLLPHPHSIDSNIFDCNAIRL